MNSLHNSSFLGILDSSSFHYSRFFKNSFQLIFTFFIVNSSMKNLSIFDIQNPKIAVEMLFYSAFTSRQTVLSLKMVPERVLILNLARVFSKESSKLNKVHEWIHFILSFSVNSSFEIRVQCSFHYSSFFAKMNVDSFMKIHDELKINSSCNPWENV